MNGKFWRLILLTGPLAFAACDDIPGLPVPDPFVDSTVVAAPSAPAPLAVAPTGQPRMHAGNAVALQISDPLALLGGLALVSSR